MKFPTQPSNKSEGINSFLEEVTKTVFGVSRRKSLMGDTCVTCQGKATTFKNSISRKEVTISGMCQTCLDSVFGA